MSKRRRISHSFVPPSKKRRSTRAGTQNRYRWAEMKPFKKNGRMVYPSMLFPGGIEGRRAVDAAHHWGAANNAKFESKKTPDGKKVRIWRTQ